MVLVVDDEAAGAGRITLASPLLRVLHSPRAGAAAARNVGLREARNQTVLFTDDDCIVPPSWVHDLATVLATGECEAVAGRVSTDATGPATAFINYQRIFDAPPDDSFTTRHLVTANCGVRRDLIPPWVGFDESILGAGGEDTEFGYRLRENGLVIRWLPEPTPVRHALVEGIEQITARFLRYGRANARLYCCNGRWQESVPFAFDWYRSISRGATADGRGFSEICSDEISAAFRACELAANASFLMGYLEEVARFLGFEFLKVRHDSLGRAWKGLSEEIAKACENVEPASWARMDICWRSAARRRFERRESLPLEVGVSDVLDHCADTTEKRIPDDVLAFVDAWAAEHQHQQREWASRLRPLARDLAEGSTPSDVNLIDSCLRNEGVSFVDGCGFIEQLLGEAPGGAVLGRLRTRS